MIESVVTRQEDDLSLTVYYNSQEKGAYHATKGHTREHQNWSEGFLWEGMGEAG